MTYSALHYILALVLDVCLHQNQDIPTIIYFLEV